MSPITALACLAFLVLIHKAEYLINAKVVGSRTQMAVWELLAVMFVAEAVSGPAGLVAAPLFYAYLQEGAEGGRAWSSARACPDLDRFRSELRTDDRALMLWKIRRIFH